MTPSPSALPELDDELQADDAGEASESPSAALSDAERLDYVYSFVRRLEPLLAAAEEELPNVLKVAQQMADNPLVKMLSGGAADAGAPSLPPLPRLFGMGRR